MKPDGLIKRDVEDELRCDPRIDDSAVAVAVSGGVVTLSGLVRTHRQRSVVMQIAEWVTGSTVNAAQLAVQPPDEVGFLDSEIARRAEDALRWDVEVPSSRITVRVDDGTLTLDGDVHWEFERQAADRAVRHLAGIHRVTNRVQVLPQRLEPCDALYLSSRPASIANRT